MQAFVVMNRLISQSPETQNPAQQNDSPEGRPAQQLLARGRSQTETPALRRRQYLPVNFLTGRLNVLSRSPHYHKLPLLSRDLMFTFYFGGLSFNFIRHLVCMILICERSGLKALQWTTPPGPTFNTFQ